MRDSFFDASVGRHDDEQLLETCISGYLRHWYTAIADFMEVVGDAGARIGRTTGVGAINAGHDLIMRFWSKGQKEVVIEKEMNILMFEEAMAHVAKCTQSMKDELQRFVNL